jgi:hypothetical protein
MTSPAEGDPAVAPGSPGASGSPPVGAPPPGAAGSRPQGSSPTPATHHHPSAAAQITSGEWPAQAADRIVDLVDTVRDKTTGPLQKAARAAVYGLVAVILGVVVVVLVIILAIRVLDVLVDEFVPWGGIWLPYLILGAIFIVAGSFLFRRRRHAPA